MCADTLTRDSNTFVPAIGAGTKGNLDSLIEHAVMAAELSAGTPSQWLAKHGDARMIAVLGFGALPAEASSTPGSVDGQTPKGAGRERENGTLAEWTPAEERFVIENMAWMTDEEIGEKLGRSADAINVHRFRYMRYNSRRKDPDWPTLQQVMVLLGVKCQKSVAMWVNVGLIPARTLPTAMGEIRAISRQTLYRWAVNPENWIYFKPENVQDPYLRRLLELRRQRWNDEWWTPGQVGAYHGVTHMAINNRIHAGTLPAKRWGNWWIKRSDAMALRIFPQSGCHQALDWTSAGDAFLLLARGLGYSYVAIGKLCGWDDGTVVFRLKALHKKGMVERLIQEYKLAVQYDGASGALFADWRDYPNRFPRLEAAIRRFREGKAKRADLSYVAYTLRAWWQWHAETEADRIVAQKIAHASSLTTKTLTRYYVQLQARSLEPLGGRV